jgi:hypothetical protein
MSKTIPQMLRMSTGRIESQSFVESCIGLVL